ncbi:Rhodanese-like domain protein [Bacillus thuringiensis IBL 4222]|nr:Rhodanese-like domain protein [Bacillus thuringiensis serovar sotto str. T04001]EEN00951.1 Rhodanese-like domain protein [Bacillus thuringiensis IBL 4222]
MVENVCGKETKGFIVYKEELHMTEVKTITTEEVQVRLENGETLFLVDVREDEEVAAGKIPEAVHIKMGDIPHKVDFFNKENEYIFICRSGMRSENVCHYLNEQGFKTVNMVGGMLQYEGETK